MDPVVYVQVVAVLAKFIVKSAGSVYACPSVCQSVLRPSLPPSV